MVGSGHAQGQKDLADLVKDRGCNRLESHLLSGRKLVDEQKHLVVLEKCSAQLVLSRDVGRYTSHSLHCVYDFRSSDGLERHAESSLPDLGKGLSKVLGGFF